MAARAIIRKVHLKPQAFPTIRAFVSNGKGKTTIKHLVPTNITKTTKEWKMQNFEEVVQTGLKLLQDLQREGVEEEKMSDSTDMLIDSLKTIYQLWMEKIEEEQRILLQQGWTCLRDFLRGQGLETCHLRLLLSIKHIEPDQTAAFIEPIQGIIEFATASPEKGITKLQRLSLRHPGPYQLPRQAVDGMVCITTENAFLLYEPNTGVTSRWIETTISRDLCRGKPRRQLESIALGFDPEIWKYKVVCISSDVKKKFAPETKAETDGVLVVEVLTVRDSAWIGGEHNWRRLEADGLPPAFQFGERFTIVDGPIYLDGKIHWHMHYNRRCPYILVFNVESETFEYIPIPTVLVQEFVDSLQHVLSRLMEVDGKIAILKSTSDQETSSLHICHHLKGTRIKWKEEKVSIPYAHVCSASSVEALTETDYIFIQSRRHIYYYNRKTKASLSLRLPASLIHDHFDWGRIVQL